MTGHPVHVWWARLEDARPDLRALLDPVERARYESTVDPAGRGRFLVGCALSRVVLGELLGLPPADVPLRRVCPRCGGPHGKVHLDLARLPAGPSGAAAAHDFSVTHSGALIGVAVCQGGEVGLDVEESHDAVDVDSAARVALSDQELTALYARAAAERRLAFLRTWTRKEAVLKALGVGLGVPLRELEVPAPEHPPTVLTWPSELTRHPHVTMADLAVDDTHPATVAVAEVATEVEAVTVADAATEVEAVTVADAATEVEAMTVADAATEVEADADAEAGREEGPAAKAEPGGVRVTVHDGSKALAAYGR